MEHEQSQNFNERLSQWVSGQGFWFQLRYSMAASAKGTAAFHLLRFGARLMVLLLVAAIGFWIYLIKRVDKESFREQAQASVNAALAATETQLQKISRSAGELTISRLASEGGESTFFNTLEARAISVPMGLLDGFRGRWSPGTITLGHLEIDLRGGADDAGSSANIGKVLFGMPADFEFDGLEVKDANLRWGYSEKTRGEIQGSLLRATRITRGWRLQFEGGRFSQNWLRRLEIESLVAICERDGIRFESARFRKGQGTVDFKGLAVAAGPRPEVKGIVKIRHLPVDEAIPAAARDFLEGSISGDFRVFGSTYTAEGIGFEGTVVLGEGDTLVLRERLHLLKALSVVDVFNNYGRLDFNEGSFTLRTTGGTTAVTAVNIRAGDLMTVEGGVMVRPPNDTEIESGAVMSPFPVMPPSFESAGESSRGPKQGLDGDSLTLRKAARAGQERGQGEGDVFERVNLQMDARMLMEQQAERSARALVYEGSFRITLPGDAFERAEGLKAMFPKADDGRIPMNVPIRGNLFDLTLDQAEELYRRSRR